MEELLKNDQFAQYVFKQLHPNLSEEAALDEVTKSFADYITALELWKASEASKH